MLSVGVRVIFILEIELDLMLGFNFVYFFLSHSRYYRSVYVRLRSR